MSRTLQYINISRALDECSRHDKI